MGTSEDGAPAQRWNPEQYAERAGYVARLGRPLIDLLAPRPGERILDVGCGDGTLSLELARTGAAVVAIDLDENQVAAARARGLDARVVDARRVDFDAEFDAVFSNAALHWITDASGVVDGLWRALKPGGRFVAELGGEGNVAAIRRALARALERRGFDAAMRDPWYFPSPEAYRALLESRGFVVESIAHFPRPTELPGDMVEWLGIFAQSFLQGLSRADREAICEEVSETLAEEMRDSHGVWRADYVRLRVKALKPVGSA